MTVTIWDEGLCVESRIFADVPWPAALAVFNAASAIHNNRNKLIDQVQSQYGQGFQRDPATWTDHLALRVALGKAAKDCGWFKRIELGGTTRRCNLYVSWRYRNSDTDLIRKIDAVRAWIDCA